jgi:putative SOS response-associated peptidase YedK
MARLGQARAASIWRRPVTNIRNVSTPHRQAWLGRRNRCLAPAKSFCEYADTKPRKTPVWFALGEKGPLFALAGLWTPWHTVRGPKSAPVEGKHELFDFLTTEANAIVAPIQPKAMPVILTTPEEAELWLSAETAGALVLQHPSPEYALRSSRRARRRTETPSFSLHRIAVSARAYPPIKATLPAGSTVYPPERNAKGQYLLWLSEAEANRLTVVRRSGESYSEAVIRLAKEQN